MKDTRALNTCATRFVSALLPPRGQIERQIPVLTKRSVPQLRCEEHAAELAAVPAEKRVARVRIVLQKHRTFRRGLLHAVDVHPVQLAPRQTKVRDPGLERRQPPRRVRRADSQHHPRRRRRQSANRLTQRRMRALRRALRRRRIGKLASPLVPVEPREQPVGVCLGRQGGRVRRGRAEARDRRRRRRGGGREGVGRGRRSEPAGAAERTARRLTADRVQRLERVRVGELRRRAVLVLRGVFRGGARGERDTAGDAEASPASPGRRTDSRRRDRDDDARGHDRGHVVRHASTASPLVYVYASRSPCCRSSAFFAASQHRLYLSMSGWHFP
mmetsp:Transcript_2230/g.8797  ORF Transcript_2230/g.8797 Transcript_2230/m.8797 type:complete len:330 (+) Transcript_2230:292-1281(+)